MSPKGRGSLKKIPDEIDFYEHQLKGIRHLARVGSFILADDMGLGKTLQALTITAIDFEKYGAKRVLIVTQASLKENFADDVEKFTSLTWTILDGKDKAKRSKQIDELGDVELLVVNYEQVVAHVDELNKYKWDVIVYDEAHCIKGHKSKRTLACFKLVGGRHFLLTGSPVLNQVDDLWALLHRVAPHEFPNYYHFVNRYAVWGGYKDKQIVDVKNEQELRDRTSKYILRREKKDCLDLPDKMHVVVELEMSPLQRTIYNQVKHEKLITHDDLDEAFEVKNDMTAALRFRQVCVSPAAIHMVEGKQLPDDSPKLDAIVSKIIELRIAGHSCVVFSQFRTVVELILKRLEKLGCPYARLDGSVKKEDRRSVIRSWEHATLNGDPMPIVGTYQVLGTGHNLQCASYILKADKLYVPLLDEQAEDRCQRIGQKSQVIIYEFRMKNSYETKIERILKQKRGVFGAVIVKDAGTDPWKKLLLAAVQEDDEDDR